MQAEALTEMGKLLHKQRDYRRARAQLQKAVDLRPDSLQVRGLCSCWH
jgi:Flp pilus assembly protein TadD